MKILILGANGFIGAPLLNEVLAQGHKVRVLTRREGGAYPVAVELFKGDLTSDTLDVDSLVSDCDIVINCAGEIRNEQLMQELHVNATHRLLGAIARRLTQPGRRCHWVQLSSVGAYGPASGQERVVTEDTQPNPIGVYEVTKTEADRLVVDATNHTGFTYAILRPSNVYGSGMPNNSLRQLASLIRRRIFIYVGFERSVATYIHVDDVVKALVLCAFEKNARGQIFNISNDCFFDEVINGLADSMHVSRPFLRLPESLVRALVAVVGKVSNLPVTQKRIDALTVKTWYPSSKLEKMLGFSPRCSVPKTIAEMLK